MSTYNTLSWVRKYLSRYPTYLELSMYVAAKAFLRISVHAHGIYRVV